MFSNFECFAGSKIEELETKKNDLNKSLNSFQEVEETLVDFVNASKIHSDSLKAKVRDELL